MRATYQPHSPTQPPHAKMWTTSCHRSHQTKQQRGPAGAGLTVPNMVIGTGALSWPCGARQVSGARPTEPPCQGPELGPEPPDPPGQQRHEARATVPGNCMGPERPRPRPTVPPDATALEPDQPGHQAR